MTLIENYGVYKYTEISVPITLGGSLPDDEWIEEYLDIQCDSFKQENCYIGKQLVTEMCIERKNKVEYSQFSAAQWQCDLLIPEVKTEEEAILIVEDLCEVLTFALAKHFKFHRRGMAGFSFRSVDIRRRYATEDLVFSDIDLTSSILVMQRGRISSRINIFKLPQTQESFTSLYLNLRKAFLTALKSKDYVSRYILLYYLFEIMYTTDEYQNLAKKMYSNKNVGKQERNKVLFEYLKQEWGIAEYDGLENRLPLDADILGRIINTRNDLTHRADTSNISDLMYHHLIPILQEVMVSMGKTS